MKIALVNPHIVSQKDDFSGSGIPYMPIGLASLAAYLRERGHEVRVVDTFGEAPHQIRRTKTHYVQGLTETAAVERIHSDTELIGFYAHLTVTHNALLRIIKAVKVRFPACPSIVLENVNKVNSYSLRQVCREFFELGVDYAVLGYIERRTGRLVESLARGIAPPPSDGIIARSNPDTVIPPDESGDHSDLDSLPFPAWDLFPIENYWKLGYAHAPLTTDRYLPLLTSRGCPYNCGFCIGPEVTGRKWHARSAENVAAEIRFMHDKFGVSEFHVEDVNPTLDKKRMIRMSQILTEQGPVVIWKLAQGTKLESLDDEVIGAMSKAGLKYVSFSPESGSKRILDLMDKPVDTEKSVEIARVLKANGIYSQACFVIGYPGEEAEDRKRTGSLVRRLAAAGVDEVALFIITPMPGSRIFAGYKGAIPSLENLTFTPKWRPDYGRLSVYRKALYAQYILIKLFLHPLRTFGYGWALLTGRFRTKVEMTIYRKLKVLKLLYFGSGSSS